MDQLYEGLLHDMDVALQKLTSQVPPPQRVPFTADNFVFRYVERTAHQAIVQKLARIITGLRAALLLLRNGLVQEESVIERILDELREDVTFLVYGIMHCELEGNLHKSFLVSFYEEEFDDPDSPFSSTQKRPMVSRQKIQAYIAKIELPASNPSDNQEVARTITKAFSGFVHCASPQIMEMYGGNPPHFHVYGMLGTPRIQAHDKQIWYYFDRGIATFILAAGAFLDRELFEYLSSQKRNFATATGRQPIEIADFAELLQKHPRHLTES
jgi:hypothetical protein